MANLQNLSRWYDVQLHKAQLLDNLFDNYLPAGYADKVIEVLKAQGKSYKKIKDRHIWDVRACRVKNAAIHNILVTIATENKNQIELLRDTANNALQASN